MTDGSVLEFVLPTEASSVCCFAVLWNPTDVRPLSDVANVIVVATGVVAFGVLKVAAGLVTVGWALEMLMGDDDGLFMMEDWGCVWVEARGSAVAFLAVIFDRVTATVVWVWIRLDDVPPPPVDDDPAVTVVRLAGVVSANAP